MTRVLGLPYFLTERNLGNLVIQIAPFGGRGTVVGTLFGAILLILMQTSLNQLHVSAYYQ